MQNNYLNILLYIYTKPFLSADEVGTLLGGCCGRTAKTYINNLNNRKDVNPNNLIHKTKLGYRTDDIIREFKLQETFQRVKALYDISLKNKMLQAA